MSFTDSDESECEKQCTRNDSNGITNEEEGQKQKEEGKNQKEENKNQKEEDKNNEIRPDENTKDKIVYR